MVATLPERCDETTRGAQKSSARPLAALAVAQPRNRTAWEDAVYQSGIPASHIAVVLRVARYADWTGDRPGTNAHPGEERLAADCGVSVATVGRALDAAVAARVLVLTARRTSGGQHGQPKANTYAACVPVESGHTVRGVTTDPSDNAHVVSLRERTRDLSADQAVSQRTQTALSEGSPVTPHHKDHENQPPPVESRPSPAVAVAPSGGEGRIYGEPDDDALTIEALPPQLRPGSPHRRRVLAALRPWLAKGWTVSELAAEAFASLPVEVRNPAALIETRLAEIDNTVPPSERAARQRAVQAAIDAAPACDAHGTPNGTYRDEQGRPRCALCRAGSPAYRRCDRCGPNSHFVDDPCPIPAIANTAPCTHGKTSRSCVRCAAERNAATPTAATA